MEVIVLTNELRGTAKKWQKSLKNSQHMNVLHSFEISKTVFKIFLAHYQVSYRFAGINGGGRQERRMAALKRETLKSFKKLLSKTVFKFPRGYKIMEYTNSKKSIVIRFRKVV